MDAAARPLAIITGGSSGIGLAVAGLLARKGCRVALVARDSARLAAAAERLAASGAGGVMTRQADVADGAAVTAAIESLIAEAGPPLWLVTAAGIVEPGFFLDQDLARTEAQLAVNVMGTAGAVRAAVPAMVAAGRGRVVLVSSGAGLFGIAGYGGYCASKFAVRGLAEVLRVELAGTGVSVTLAVPSDTDTPQLAYEAERRPTAIAPLAGAGPVLAAEAVARHMVAAAERGRFLSAPGLRLGVLAWLQDFISARTAALQIRLLRRADRR